jgi:hypothetical protein
VLSIPRFLHPVFNNYCRVHQTLRVTPAMEAKIADHVWDIEELVGLLEADEQKMIENGAKYRAKIQNSD